MIQMTSKDFRAFQGVPWAYREYHEFSSVFQVASEGAGEFHGVLVGLRLFLGSFRFREVSRVFQGASEEFPESFTGFSESFSGP